ncbi:MAG: NAD(P)H-binding protein [Burkholderiales bacterium]|nr:NAD(P)H-binding protein [Burkholderiales bacterium]
MPVDRESLARACVGADRVLAAAHSALGRGRHRSELVDGAGHRALIDAARAAGVRRFVYTSALGAAADHPVDFFRTKYAVEEYLRASGLGHVILRPSAFMEAHAHAFNGKSILDKGRTLVLGSGRKRRNFVAARDVARVAVDALTGAAPLPAVIAIGGPGNFTTDEVAGIYARCAGIAARVRHVPASLLRLLAPVARAAHPGIGRVLTIASLPDDAYLEGYDPVPGAGQVIGVTSLEAFVRERVAESRLQ